MDINPVSDIPNDETAFPLLMTHQSFSSESESSPSLNQYAVATMSSSDYLKFPANLALSKQRARKHKIRDRGLYGYRGHLPLLIDKEEFLKYSMSSYFYFDYIEQGICIMLITFLICGLYDLVSILAYPQDDSAADADLSFVFHLSTLNLNYFPSVLTVKLSLAMINVLVVKIYSIIKEKARIRKYLKQKNSSQNYFSILVQGLPLDLDLDGFSDFLAHHLSDKSEKIKKVIVLQGNHEKQRLLELRKNMYVKSLSVKSESLASKFTREIQKIDDEIAKEDAKLSANERFNGSLLVLLEDSYTALKILKKWRRLSVPKILFAKILRKFGSDYLQEYEFKEKFISIEKAGEPFDVIWQNSGKSRTNIFFRSLFASIILWGAVLIYPLVNITVTNTEKSKMSLQDNDLLGNVWEYTPYIISVISINLVIILLINFISIFLGLRRKSDVEKRKIGMKVAFSFISYALLISAKSFLDSAIVQNDANQESAKESLVNTISLLMFYLIFLPQILELLDVEFLYKYFRRKYYLRKNQFSTLSQGELDEIVKQPYFDFSTRVANVAQTVFLALVAAPIFPIAPLLAIAALLAALMIDRYLILRRCSDWKLVGTTLGMSFSKAFNYNIVVQITGNILFLIFSEPQSGSAAQFILVFLMGLGYVFCINNYLAPIITKHAYADLRVQNSKCENEEHKFKILYEDLYQDYLMNGR